VATAHGINTDSSTFGYITGWAHGDTATVRAAAETVTTAARAILDAIDTTEENSNPPAQTP